MVCCGEETCVGHVEKASSCVVQALDRGGLCAEGRALLTRGIGCVERRSVQTLGDTLDSPWAGKGPWDRTDKGPPTWTCPIYLDFLLRDPRPNKPMLPWPQSARSSQAQCSGHPLGVRPVCLLGCHDSHPICSLRLNACPLHLISISHSSTQSSLQHSHPHFLKNHAGSTPSSSHPNIQQLPPTIFIHSPLCTHVPQTQHRRYFLPQIAINPSNLTSP